MKIHAIRSFHGDALSLQQLYEPFQLATSRIRHDARIAMPAEHTVKAALPTAELCE